MIQDRLVKLSDSKYVFKFGHNNERRYVIVKQGSTNRGRIDLPPRLMLPAELIGKKIKIVLEVLEDE